MLLTAGKSLTDVSNTGGLGTHDSKARMLDLEREIASQRKMVRAIIQHHNFGVPQ